MILTNKILHGKENKWRRSTSSQKSGNRHGNLPPAWKHGSAVQNIWNKFSRHWIASNDPWEWRNKANPKKRETDDMSPVTVPASRPWPWGEKKNTEAEPSTMPALKRCEKPGRWEQLEISGQSTRGKSAEQERSPEICKYPSVFSKVQLSTCMQGSNPWPGKEPPERITGSSTLHSHGNGACSHQPNWETRQSQSLG